MPITRPLCPPEFRRSSSLMEKNSSTCLRNLSWAFHRFVRTASTTIPSRSFGSSRRPASNGMDLAAVRAAADAEAG